MILTSIRRLSKIFTVCRGESRRAAVNFISIVFILFLAFEASAFDPLRDPGKLWEAQKESVKRVTSARVILADYNLIRKDFPEIRIFTNEQVDEWLIRNTAFVSKEQAAQTQVNDPISTAEDYVEAYRPREYRRAHVFSTDTGGLIDAKGTGSVDPSGGSHENGLATLGDMIREYIYEKMIHAVFERAGRYDTVGCYAVIDYGFSIIHPDGSRSRAGTVLRQAHVRYHGGPIGRRHRSQATVLPENLQLEMELFLRTLGITSSVAWFDRDLLNIQGAENGAVVDFGSFLVRERFSRPMSFFYDKEGNVRSSMAPDFIMSPRDKNFIQPDLNLRIPFNIWGYSQTGKPDPKLDNPFVWSHQLAEGLASGHATRADAEQHVRNFFDQEPVQKVLRSIPRSCKSILK